MHRAGSARQNVPAGTIVDQVVIDKTNFLIVLAGCFTGANSLRTQTKPVKREVICSNGKATAIDWLSDIPAQELLHICIYSHRLLLYSVSVGYFFISCVLFFSSFVFCSRRNHPQDSRTATFWSWRKEQEVTRIYSPGGVGENIVIHLYHPLQGSGTIAEEGAERM